MPNGSEVVVVSGLPRSGTSMMMRMIAAAGVEPLTDGIRAPDEDNPLGYSELEAVKRTREDASWLARAPGKVVKLVHLLVKDLPPTYRYRVVMMHRDLDEVLASQKIMLARSGRPGAQLSSDALKRVYAMQLDEVRNWMDAHPWFSRLDVRYDQVLADPRGQAERICAFLSLPGAAGAMAAAVDPALYRNRGTSPRS